MGLRSSGTVALAFEDCRVPASSLIGSEGGGHRIALAALGSASPRRPSRRIDEGTNEIQRIVIAKHLIPSQPTGTS